jgi:glycosyltransferase involved in cell wall biosynthesis
MMISSATNMSTATRKLRVLAVAVRASDEERALAEDLIAHPRIAGTLVRSGTTRALLDGSRTVDVTLIAGGGTRAVLWRRLLHAAGRRTVHLDGFAGLEGAGVDTMVSELAMLAHRPGAALRPTRAVSIIVTVLNEAAQVSPLVTALEPQLRPGDELIVVDGGSTDGTLELLESRAATLPAMSVLSRPGTNISAGRNAGISVAASPVIACTDAGCSPEPDWLLGLRAAFEEPATPGLVASIPLVEGSSPLQDAQALACYPHPGDGERPTWLVRLWGRFFGQVFTPSLPFARSIAFTKEAWAEVGGFPEQLGWVEDGVFGLAIAQRHPAVATRDAHITWAQRGNLKGTAKMYFRYGIGVAQSRNVGLMLRDAARVAAYVGSVGVIAFFGWPGAVLVLAGAVAYYSLPAVRVVRTRAGVLPLLLVPVAMGVKDVSKVAGQLTAHVRSVTGRLRSRPAS